MTDSLIAYDVASDITAFQLLLANPTRSANYIKYREYYDGVQNLAFATKKFTNTFGTQFATFAYNRCSGVVDAIADRLQLQGFTLEGNQVQTEQVDPTVAKADPVKEAIDQVWRENRLDKGQGELISEVLKCGDAYLIVWPEIKADGTAIPRFYVNEAGTCAVITDPETKRTLKAAKAWRIESGKYLGFWRLTLYYPDAIYKYISLAKKDGLPKKVTDFVPYDPAIDGNATEPWPLANPFGQVPVFHFSNNSPTGRYGKSELRDVIPLQDAINKSCMDLMVAMEYGAFRQRWATGLNLGMPDPITGVIPSPYKIGPGEVWAGPNGAQFGDFNVTDLKQFLEVTDKYDAKISNVARIPAYWLTLSMSTSLSGEALKTADSPFVKKLTDRQISFGNDWEDAFKFALLTMKVDVDTLKSQWLSAELRSEQDVAQVSMIKAGFGVPEEKLWEENGYSPGEIAGFKQAKEQAVLDMQRVAASGGLTPFNTGPNDPNNTSIGQSNSGSGKPTNETAQVAGR